MIDALIITIQLLSFIFAAAIIIRTLLSLFQVSPYHPVQRWLYQLTEPLLQPIRNLIPNSGMGLDFSPMILLILLQILEQVLISLLRQIR
jgi:YggT family protein